jgi:alpha-mannosidase
MDQLNLDKLDRKFLDLQVFEDERLQEVTSPLPLYDKNGQRQPVGIIVSHSHWDREWYLPFEGFRARLVAMLDGILETLENDPDYRSFMLDGQGIMLDDYLEVRPEAEARVRHVVSTGRLKVGPWYTATDVLLPDPESIVRNLQLGQWQARRFGGKALSVGYMPDLFGFSGQIPQLLQHFGIRDALAWRGMHPANAETVCWWESPDGSRVLVLRPQDGYSESAAAVVNPDRFIKEILPGILERQEKEPFQDRLFMAGSDHFVTRAYLPEVAQKLSERLGHPVVIGSLEEMAELVRSAHPELVTIRGEQRDSCLVICPASVAGTRIPLKLENYWVEAMLLGQSEPLQALAELVGAGSDKAHLRWAWRLLTQNHPHDSIPGCGIDEVHREMMTRFARARMVAKDLAQRGARRLARALDPKVRGELGAIGVVGLAGGKHRLRVKVHTGEEKMPAFKLTEQDGREVPFVVVGKGVEFVQYHRLQDAFATGDATSYVNLVATREWVEEQRVSPRHYRMPWLELELELEAPHAGYRILRIERADKLPAQHSVLSTQHSNQISNEYLKVWANEEGLFVEDLKTGRSFGPVYFSHRGERGDEYTAYPVTEEAPVLFRPDAVKAKVVVEGLTEWLVLPISARVPARLRADRKGRTGTVRLEGRLKVNLLGNRANLDLVLDNRARDYDLRLVTHVPGTTSARSGAHFTVEERPFEPDHVTPNAPQQNIPDFPFRGWLAAQDNTGAGLAVMARGLIEAAVKKVEDGVDLNLTLLRGVGYLSRHDLDTRPEHAGPAIETPDAQCVGEHHWELALLPFASGEVDKLPAQTEQFMRPPALFPVQWSAGSAPAERTLFVGDEHLVVTTLKPTEGDNGVILHAHNPTHIECVVEINGERVRLDETPSAGGNLVKPFQVAAWRLPLEG